ncbi:CDP-glucose 4/6-dehydratase [Synechococcus sp. PROS-9-1]|uniref:CDP-glucose 4,6-dehydratase n=1 Tax=Synechococcus sp. PROS-9-1 TaxID=1968775 RepID=UPI0016471E71|nr:CDP-glucose 4,6-dehydratase [Synechococcus sp. PROS-9-1]QNJ30618.1 CDP-glucose 4/6-dehydratase [Synechococcus sp. PROS-9-1]
MGIDSTFWNGRRVLLTGHTGFKGSWLALWLCQLGAEVHGLGLQPDTNPSLFGQLDLAKQLSGHHLLDIRDAAALASLVASCQPEVVLHLAAQPLVRRSYRDPLGTWATNVQGSLHLLEALKPLQHHCAVVMVTTDKVYENQEWDYGYREEDRLGGHDPYSASKAAAELSIASWRSSFCGQAPHQTPHLSIATARAGNVIGGGDWADDRIIPDAMRSLGVYEAISVRRPEATRPWQHVLEPLGGYLLLAEKLSAGADVFSSSFNFGPALEANRSVRELVETAICYWPGIWRDCSDSFAPHEAGRLHLQIDKAHHLLGWSPRWAFETTVNRTVSWYRAVHEGSNPLECCLDDLQAYEMTNTKTQPRAPTRPQ